MTHDWLLEHVSVACPQVPQSTVRVSPGMHAPPVQPFATTAQMWL